MEEDQVEIRRLLIEKLTGGISMNDEQRINQLIASDRLVQQEWTRLREKTEKAEEAGLLRNKDADSAWNQIKPAIRPRNNIRRITTIAAAVAACFAAFIAVRHFRAAGTDTSAGQFFAENSTQIAGNDSILMQNEDGSLLNLSAVIGHQLEADNTRMTVTDSSITLSNNRAEKGQWSTLLVPAAMNYKITLTDGTEVWLNANTRLRFPQSFAGLKHRDIYVDGEAYFKVAPDKQQPFIVHTAQTDIKVLGTQFNVNTYDTTGIKTALIEGSVSTTAAGGSLLLNPGQQTVYSGERFTTGSFDATTTLSWMQGIYYFEEVPLYTLTDIISRWFKMKVAFHTPGLQDKIFSGMLSKKQPLSAFLENLELSDNIHSVVKDNTIHFSAE